MLQVGAKFPEFNLPNQDGVNKSLKDYAGQWLVLYVYPKDDTPGCTIQGKSFTIRQEEFDDNGIVVVGLSADDVDSHKSFCTKHAFSIDLLADPEAKLLTETGIPQTEYKDTKYWERTTFVIDDKGIIRKIYNKVTPEGHERVLLAEIAGLRKATSTPA